MHVDAWKWGQKIRTESGTAGCISNVMISARGWTAFGLVRRLRSTQPMSSSKLACTWHWNELILTKCQQTNQRSRLYRTSFLHMYYSKYTYSTRWFLQKKMCKGKQTLKTLPGHAHQSQGKRQAFNLSQHNSTLPTRQPTCSDIWHILPGKLESMCKFF